MWKINEGSHSSESSESDAKAPSLSLSDDDSEEEALSLSDDDSEESLTYRDFCVTRYHSLFRNASNLCAVSLLGWVCELCWCGSPTISLTYMTWPAQQLLKQSSMYSRNIKAELKIISVIFKIQRCCEVWPLKKLPDTFRRLRLDDYRSVPGARSLYR